jgi:hypothetical protein
MIVLDVSFGIFAFMPLGWVFMIFVILIECFIATRLLIKDKWYNKKIWLTISASNIISGLVGVFASLKLNGGWWLVVWFPWISNNEVNIHDHRQIMGMIYYYLVAFALTLLIEFILNYIILRKSFNTKSLLKMTILTNIASYIIGSVILYGYSFS